MKYPKNIELKYDIKKNLPVARFNYIGNHDVAVKRTVLIIKLTKNYLCGYELREGKKVRKLKNAPIKSYNKAKIATTKQLKRKKPGKEVSTLKRENLKNLIIKGP